MYLEIIKMKKSVLKNGLQYLVFGLAIVLGTVSIVSCQKKSQGSADVSKPKIINVGITNDPSSLSPLASNNTVTAETTNLIFLPLAGIDEDGKFVYRLAESLTTEDNINFTLKIRQGIKWSDGKPTTADDVIFAYNTYTNPSAGTYNPTIYNIIAGTNDAGLYPQGQSSLEGIKKIDDYTIAVKTKYPVTLTVFTLQLLNRVKGLPKHLLENIPVDQIKTNDFWLKLPVSNGPVLFKEYIPSQYLTFVANDQYYLGRPKIDVLNFKILSGTQITAQLESGEVDLNYPGVGNIPNDDYDRILGLPHLHTSRGIPSSFQILYYNVKVIDNVKVRQALDLAIDRDGILQNILKGSTAAYVSKTPVSNRIQYWNESAAKYTYDLERAKQLVAESGWDRSKKLVFLVPTGNTTRERICILIAESFKSIGLNVVVEKMDFPTSLAHVQGRDFDIGIVGVPEQPLNDVTLLRTAVSEKYSWNNYATPRSNYLIDTILSSVDEEVLKNAYYEVQQIIADDVPVSGLYTEYGLSAINNRVTYGHLVELGSFLDFEKWDVK
jgi:peptide/nickel transport system substrate-binding protein